MSFVLNIFQNLLSFLVDKLPSEVSVLYKLTNDAFLIKVSQTEMNIPLGILISDHKCIELVGPKKVAKMDNENIKIDLCQLNGSQLAKMNKSIPDMSLP